VPLTLLLIVLLLQLSTRSAPKTLIVLLAVPFSAIGAVWFLHFLDYQMSVGVWVGLIALLGVDAETGVFMLMYLEQACEQARREGHLRNPTDLQIAIRNGAVQRLRPKFMTVATMLAGLLPIMWSDGTGSEIMKRIAAPMIGGIFTSFLLELLVYPVLYLWLMEYRSRRVGGLSSNGKLHQLCPSLEKSPAPGMGV
jgi:Cu(I)/Ag(I) efflux system membrane protein CusA/SilA